MRGRHHFDRAAGVIETAVGATLDLTFELLDHVFRTQVRQADMDAAIGRGAASQVIFR